MNLTAKQEKFVLEYLIDHNGARAARDAGYSDKTARQIATENLSKPYIQALIAAKQQEASGRLELRKEHVLAAHLEAINVARTQGKPMAMIAGAKQIGKLMGFDMPEIQKIELSVFRGAEQARYDAMSDQELMTIIETNAACQ